MNSRANLQVVLQKIPGGPIEVRHFGFRSAPIPCLGAGEVLTRTLYLSLDPYMRKRMQDAHEGRVTLHLGDPMMGRTIGVVEKSTSDAFSKGDVVLGWAGWQRFAAEPEERIVRLAPLDAPLTFHLGVLGRPGVTAWLGMIHLGNVRKGETVVVSSAAGAVGCVAGQLARHAGARVVGIAGGAAKCEWLVSQLGFDAAIDHGSPDFAERLEDATPYGVDLCFESVGARVLDTVLSCMNEGGRILLCGLLGHYEAHGAYAFRNVARFLDRALVLRGFRINDFESLHHEALVHLTDCWRRGALVQEESVTDGLENAPMAFTRMLAGTGYGKHLVRVGA